MFLIRFPECHRLAAICLATICLLTGCGRATKAQSVDPELDAAVEAELMGWEEGSAHRPAPGADAAPWQAVMHPYLADGFELPVGDGAGGGTYTCPADGKTYKGWYVATAFAEEYDLGVHPGEDWNGSGGGNTDLGQPVHACAHGQVVFAGDGGPPWGHIVMLRHWYMERGLPQLCYSVYVHLENLKVSQGSWIRRRTPLGTIGTGGGSYPAHLHFEIRKAVMTGYDPGYWPGSYDKSIAWVRQHYEDPRTFIAARRSLPVPAALPKAVVVCKHGYTMYRYQQGALLDSMPVALSQAPLEHKLREGDLRLPEGEYRVCEKLVGPFTSGSAPAFLGVRFLRLDYPNVHDANRALADGRLDKAKYQTILDAHAQNKIPPQNTGIGGGIAIHGWIEPGWSEEDTDRNLTWGCISMQKPNLIRLYDWADLNTKVFIVP